MVLLKLFLMFAKLSLFSFGGGYVVISMMLKELEMNKMATVTELTEIIAIAGMSPGPVAVNCAVGLGYKVAGFPGVVASFLGIAVPCAILVIIVAKFFFKLSEKPIVKAALNGLAPVTVALILYSALNLALKNGIIHAEPQKIVSNGLNIILECVHLIEVKSLLILLTTLIMLVKKVHPVLIILGSGVLGAVIFH